MKALKFKTLLALLVAGFALFLTGCSQNEYGVPKNLDGTVWVRCTGDLEKSRLYFKGDTCTLEREVSEDSDLISESYTFDYQAPTLKLNNPTSGELVWEGTIQSNGETYSLLTLQNANTKEHESYFLNGESVWQERQDMIWQ